jgi:hypothetical protein
MCFAQFAPDTQHIGAFEQLDYAVELIAQAGDQDFLHYLLIFRAFGLSALQLLSLAVFRRFLACVFPAWATTASPH